MGVLIRTGLQALRRRLAPRPSSAAVREALRGQPAIGAVETVEISRVEHGGALVIVGLRVGGGVDGREAACRATEVLHKHLPHAEIRVDVFGPGDGRSP